MNNRINNSFNNPINNSIKNPLIKGTIVLTLAGLFCRILGFYYRIFLNAHIGAYGMGMLQLITPLCGIAFSVCICGFNSAISRYTAADRQSLKPLISGLFLSIPMSVIFSALCYIYAGTIAEKIMLNTDCTELIRIIVISIPLSAVHSCICGYYYGCRSAFIPAASQIAEQLVRIFGVIFYYYIFIQRSDRTLNITDAIYGNIAGELCAVIFCVLALYIKKIRKHYKRVNLSSLNPTTKGKIYTLIKNLALYALPLNLNSLLVHLLESGEAILIPVQLMLYGMNNENAVSTYGIIGGMVIPLIMFPGAITNSLAVMLTPKISKDSSTNQSDNITRTISYTICVCMHLGIMCCILFVLYISRLGAIIFKQPDVYTYTIILACVCPFLYLKVSLSSILNGINKTSFTCAANITGLIIRIGFLIILVPRIGICGYIYGLIISNIVVCMLNYIKLYTIYHFKTDVISNIICPLSMSVISIASVLITEKAAFIMLPFLSQNITYTTALIAKCIASCLVYIIIFIVMYSSCHRTIQPD